MKATYGRGRPTIIGDNVTNYKCSCDYGMPSGHSSSAFMGFLILADFIDRSLFKIYTDEGQKYLKSGLRKMVYGICYFMIVAICWSRLYLGVHSFNQVIIGFTTSLIIYLFFDRQKFESMLKAVNTGIMLKIGYILIIGSPIIVYIYYLVMTSRKQPTYWKYWSRCPDCEGTFAYK